jgi:electron transfer flavoprotein beta subunit
MKILVCIKQISSLGDEIEFNDDNTDVDADYLESALNEWDSFVVEEAIQIREHQDGDAEIVVLSVGDETIEPAMRRCLAMGSDRAIRVEGLSNNDPISVGRALAGVARSEAPDLILCGVQSADSVQAATGGALAGFLDLPIVAVLTKLDYESAKKQAIGQRELEGGLIDVVEFDTPAVVTIQSGINSPRYATFRAIKQADRKEITVVQADFSSQVGYRVRRMFVPPKGNRAELLGSEAPVVAEKIANLIKEILR